jgi:hypothetical protein
MMVNLKWKLRKYDVGLFTSVFLNKYFKTKEMKTWRNALYFNTDPSFENLSRNGKLVDVSTVLDNVEIIT